MRLGTHSDPSKRGWLDQLDIPREAEPALHGHSLRVHQRHQRRDGRVHKLLYHLVEGVQACRGEGRGKEEEQDRGGRIRGKVGRGASVCVGGFVIK